MLNAHKNVLIHGEIVMHISITNNGELDGILIQVEKDLISAVLTVVGSM